MRVYVADSLSFAHAMCSLQAPAAKDPRDEDPERHSRLRQDELYHANDAVPDFAVLHKPKGKQRGGGVTKHDPAICGAQNAKYLERVRW